MAAPKYVQLRSPASYDTNKTYSVVSILEDPYLIQKSTEYGQKEEYIGFCKDLMDLIVAKMGIKCKYKLCDTCYTRDILKKCR